MGTSDAVLDSIRKLLPKGIAGDAWATDSALQAQNVALYRRYMDGDFDANMTEEMRMALRIPEGREMGANHCDLVVSAMADRLNVTGIKGDSEAATAWLGDIAELNRFDGFQMDVHEAALRDGDTYVMVDWDNDAKHVRWTHELAYDGIEGMIGIPRSRSNPELAAAIKIWHETRSAFADTLRINVYFPNEIRRWIKVGVGALVAYTEDGQPDVLPWVDKAGRPIGVPVIHFANRRRGPGGFGLSELRNVIPQQDQLNRTTHSIAMTTELSGFPIRWIKGWKPDADIVPGMFLVIAAPKKNADGSMPALTEAQAKHLAAIELGTYAQADVSPLLSAYDQTKAELAETTRTPDAGGVSDDASGEARKQAEIGLIGKISRFQVKAGNNWEDVAELSVAVNDAYATTSAPKSGRWRTMWKSAEIRNDNDIITQAVALEKLAGLRAALAHAAMVTGWDEAKIAEIVAEREAKDEAALEQMVRLAPGFAGRGSEPQPAQLPATTAPVSREGANGRDG